MYKARWKVSGEIVAIKIIPLGAQEEIAEIQKEISMLKECNHPNVVRYLVTVLARGHIFSFLERAPYASLINLTVLICTCILTLCATGELAGPRGPVDRDGVLWGRQRGGPGAGE